VISESTTSAAAAITSTSTTNSGRDTCGHFISMPFALFLLGLFAIFVLRLGVVMSVTTWRGVVVI
jgi:hypothetical protein